MWTGALLATLLLSLTACGPAASSNSGQPSSEASIGALPSFTQGAVADLEAWIPDTVAGVTMQKQSMQGDESLVGFGSEAAATLLQDLGVSLSDLSAAIGIGYSADVNVSARMFVFRAAGADSNSLEAAFKKVTDAERDTPLDWTSTSIGGKQVETAVDGDSTNYLYVKGDVLVFMVASGPDIAAEIISGLP